MKTPRKNAKLNSIIAFYLDSKAFRGLAGTTQKQYERCLRNVARSKVGKRMLGNIPVDEIGARILNECYQDWLEQYGVRGSLYNKQCLSIVWRHALAYDIMTHNPVSSIKTTWPKPRRVYWEREQIKAFLDVAYSEFKYRNVGLILHMAYDWGQRIGDMRMLTWDSLDLLNQRVDLTQSKRNAKVHLPISEGLMFMLADQQEDFGFQKWVAPKVLVHGGTMHPYAPEDIHAIVNEIKEIAGLPKELTAMDLRRTAVTEMLAGGADVAGITQVTGHKNIGSLKSYMVNTYSGASKALATRGNKDDE